MLVVLLAAISAEFPGRASHSLRLNVNSRAALGDCLAMHMEARAGAAKLTVAFPTRGQRVCSFVSSTRSHCMRCQTSTVCVRRAYLLILCQHCYAAGSPGGQRASHQSQCPTGLAASAAVVVSCSRLRPFSQPLGSRLKPLRLFARNADISLQVHLDNPSVGRASAAGYPGYGRDLNPARVSLLVVGDDGNFSGHTCVWFCSSFAIIIPHVSLSHHLKGGS